MIGLFFSYLQGVRFQNILLLLSEVQSCQVGSSWSISGISEPWLCPPHPSPLHTRANFAPAGSRHPVWAENSHPELWNGVNRPNDSSDNSRDEQRPSVPAMAELVHHLGPPKCFQTLWGHCKFWLLAWNAEMQRENCKINFRYYLFSQNTTSLLVMVLLFYGFYGFMECGFREAPAACR